MSTILNRWLLSPSIAKSKHTKTAIVTKIRNVYVTDLHKIISIYTEENTNFSAEHQNSPFAVTEKFGLPLALADYNKDVLGYAYVSINELEKPEIHLIFRKEFEKEKTKKLLNEYAKKVFSSMYPTEQQDYPGLDRYIKKFIDWLNRCH